MHGDPVRPFTQHARWSDGKLQSAVMTTGRASDSGNVSVAAELAAGQTAAVGEDPNIGRGGAASGLRCVLYHGHRSDLPGRSGWNRKGHGAVDHYAGKHVVGRRLAEGCAAVESMLERFATVQPDPHLGRYRHHAGS